MSSPPPSSVTAAIAPTTTTAAMTVGISQGRELGEGGAGIRAGEGPEGGGAAAGCAGGGADGGVGSVGVGEAGDGRASGGGGPGDMRGGVVGERAAEAEGRAGAAAGGDVDDDGGGAEAAGGGDGVDDSGATSMMVTALAATKPLLPSGRSTFSQCSSRPLARYRVPGLRRPRTVLPSCATTGVSCSTVNQISSATYAPRSGNGSGAPWMTISRDWVKTDR